MGKVEEYYDKTATLHAYTFMMCAHFFLLFGIHSLILLIVLDPDTKMNHFVKHWSKPLQDKVLESAETIVCSSYRYSCPFTHFRQFKEHYLELYSVDGAPPAAIKKGNKKLSRLLAEDSTDDEMDAPSTSPTPLPDSDTHKPWLHEFRQYLDGFDEVPME